MKTLILFALCLFSLSEASLAGVRDLTPEAKELVFEAIADYVYVEKRGLARSPQHVFDFTYDMVNSETLIVTGGSYSPLDQQVLEYHCQIEILGRETIESSYDFEVVSCELTPKS